MKNEKKTASLLEQNANPLVLYLQKPAAEFTRTDLVRYMEAHDIHMLNFRYPGADGRLKTLNFVVTDRNYLDSVLAGGERVDGSSLFPYIEAGSSDLYVVPRYRSAFLNPFSSIPTLDILCSYFDKDGNPLASAPDNVLRRAAEALSRRCGVRLDAMGELEYYLVSPKDTLYPAVDQRGYHEAAPFANWENMRCEALYTIARCGGLPKYGHSEVGNFIQDDLEYVQNEIEFMPTLITEAADQLVIAKWILRQLGQKYGVLVTFAPKITVGKAGSGMHVHLRLMQGEKNVTSEAGGRLSDQSRRVIAGILDLAPSLCAFGNTIPTSYLRLVPHQEAPTNICWGDRNRSVLVRVPLGWNAGEDMASLANPGHQPAPADLKADRQTFEFRSPDGSADVYMLLAGLLVAARHGLEMEDGLARAEKSYVQVNIFHNHDEIGKRGLRQLPDSCSRAAACLEEQAEIYCRHGVFSQGIIEGVAKKLRSYSDSDLRSRLEGKPQEMQALVNAFLHCG